MEAFRAYLDGLEHFIRGEWRTALVDFRRSSELEPEYALPRIVSAGEPVPITIRESHATLSVPAGREPEVMILKILKNLRVRPHGRSRRYEGSTGSAYGHHDQ